MSTPASTTRVLLVEDNPADARLIAELLREVQGRAFEISTFTHLGDALRHDGGVDVILLDLSLPDAQSLETVERMLAAHRDVPVVVLTGLADELIAQQAMVLGAQDYLVKHEITPALVARTVLYAIERKRAELHAKAAHAAERFQLLAELGEVLVSSLDLGELARRVASALVPRMADWVAFDLWDEEGRLERLALAGVDAHLDPAQGGGTRSIGATAIHESIAAGQSVLLPQCSEAQVRRLLFGAGHDDANLGVHKASVLSVPLRSRSGVLGALTLVRGQTSYGSEEQVLGADIARRVALSVENARLYRLSQRAVQARDEVVAVVSHDLRGPLNLLGLALSRLREPGVSEAQRGDLLARADRAHVGMVKMVEDLLDITRIEAGTLSLDMQRADFGALVRELADSHLPLAEARQLQLVIEVRTDAHCKVRVDRHRFAQVLSNLLGNAIKFTPRGGTIHVVASSEGQRVRVEVVDTGPGIPPAHLPHVFDRFWQPRERRDGAGLGLAIVKGIVEAHGGTVTVRSEPGKGARFCVELPKEAVVGPDAKRDS